MDKIKNAFGAVREKWNSFKEKTAPARRVAGKTGHVIGQIGLWIYRLRSILLAIPLGVTAAFLATRNAAQLPEIIQITIPTIQDGALVLVSQAVTKYLAVVCPLALTGVCILMMIISRRMSYPFVIGVFTLVLPLAIYYMNFLHL